MKKTIRRLFFLFLLCGVPLMGGEIWARSRYTELDLLFSRHNMLYQDNPVLLWTLRKNATLDLDRIRYTINSHGMRSPEIQSPKPEGKRRILMVGESSTMGAGVEQHQTYSSVLAKKLGTDFDVVNAGTGAWTIYQSWTLLKYFGDDLDIDALVVYHQMNDRLPMGVVDKNNFLYAVTSTDRTMIERREVVAPVLSLLLQSRLYLAARKQILMGSKLPSTHQDNRTYSPRVPDADREVAWNGILDWCTERRVFLLVVWPMYGHSYEDDTMLKGFLQRNSLPMVDIPTLATQAGFTTPTFLHDGTHPSVAGHEFLATAIQSGLSPWMNLRY